jgi:hypothetical protein
MPNDRNRKVEKPFSKTRFFQKLKPEGITVLEPSVKVGDKTAIQGSGK